MFFALLKKTASTEQLRVIFERERECTRIRKKRHNRQKKAQKKSCHDPNMFTVPSHDPRTHDGPSAVDRQGPVAQRRSVADSGRTACCEGEPDDAGDMDSEVTSMEVDGGEGEGDIEVTPNEGGDMGSGKALLEREGEKTISEGEGFVTLEEGVVHEGDRIFEGRGVTMFEGEGVVMLEEGVIDGERSTLDRVGVVTLKLSAVERGEMTTEKGGERGTVVKLDEGGMLDSNGKRATLPSEMVALEEGEIRPVEERENNISVVRLEEGEGKHQVTKGAIDVVMLEREHKAAQDFEEASCVNFTSFTLPE